MFAALIRRLYSMCYAGTEPNIMQRHPALTSSVAVVLFLSVISLSEGICRNLKVKKIASNSALANHSIRTIQPISDKETCRRECFLESRCFSINVCTRPDETLSCDLTNSDHIRNELARKPGCTHYGSENACSSSPCQKNATCQGDFDNDPVPYRCLCPAGYTGPACNDGVDECKSGSHGCHKNATCENTEGGYNCTCDKGYHGDGRKCEAICPVKSSGVTNQSELLHHVSLEGVGYSIFCSYSNFSCGSGIWKLALKIDGKKKNFHYDSSLWTDKNVSNTAAAKTGLDNLETKTSAYWDTSLTKLCLGMKYGGVTRWISVAITAPSLQNVISSNVENNTHLGEAKWRSLLPAGIISLQNNCKKEGLNLDGSSNLKVRRLRLGFFTDSSSNCRSYKSFIGVGSRLDGDRRGNGFSCGNYADSSGSDNGPKYNTAICYILVQ